MESNHFGSLKPAYRLATEAFTVQAIPQKQDTNGRLEPPNIVFFQYIVLSIYRFAVCVFIARTGKLEFPTSALTAQRSNQLNYARE